MKSPPPPKLVLATKMDLESLPLLQALLVAQIVLESSLATKAVVDEKKDALEEEGPKVVANEVESKEEDFEEEEKPALCVASKGTPTKAKAKKRASVEEYGREKPGAPSADVAADGTSLQVSQVNGAAIRGAKLFSKQY